LSATRRSTPADLAALRIDFADWLCGLSLRHRQIALCLAGGERTSALAARYRVTPARISQIRRELADGWDCFQGESDRTSSPAGYGAEGSSGPQHACHRRRTSVECVPVATSAGFTA
jgi:hypothetical protein